MGFWVMIISFIAGLTLIVLTFTQDKESKKPLFKRVILFIMGLAFILFSIYLAMPK